MRILVAIAILLTTLGACADTHAGSASPSALYGNGEASALWGRPGPVDLQGAVDRRSDYRIEPWTAGRGAISALAFLPDGRALVAEKGGFGGPATGKVVLVSADGKQASEVLQLPVCSAQEWGLVGLTVDPDFASDPYVYVYYTRQMAGCHAGAVGEVPPPGERVYNRLSRFTFTGGALDPGSERVLLDDIPGYQSGHNGGGLRFGTDGMLFVGVGNGQLDRLRVSQDLRSLNGKILRIDPRNPSVPPAGNPFGNLVWAYGLRNPFGFDVDPRTGRLFAGDVGSDPPRAAEEVNEIQRGGNYGWPLVEGAGGGDRYIDPIVSYGHGKCVTVIGGIVLGNALGPQHRGSFVIGDFGCGRIWAVDPDRGGRGVTLLAEQPGNITHIEEGPGGVPFISTTEGAIFKLVAL